MAIAAGQIVYIDYESGSNTARTLLTNATASNPSGTIVRITYNNHGLTNGTAIVLTNFTAWLNTYFLIENVTTNTFDLVNTTWQATADPTGDVRPLGGQSWADAWKTTQGPSNYGAGYPSGEFRFAKSNDPTSIGNATWTDLSATATLATAQTALIDNAEVNWTAANSATCATQTNRKQGNTSVRTTLPGTPAINTKYSYRATGTLNLSAYQKITFWIQTGATTSDANRFKIKLCSDTTGDVAVDEFTIPTLQSSQNWFTMTLARDGNGNLGSNIQSIALYSGSSAPAASFYVQLDNISACTTSGLCLDSMISKSTNPKNMDHTWHQLASITGTTLVLDDTVATAFGTYQGYSGTTETVTTYTFIPIKIIPSNATIFDSQSTGTSTANVKYLGGWNKSNSTQDGYTFFNCDGYYSNLSSFTPFNIFRGFYYVENIGFARMQNENRFYGGSSSTYTKMHFTNGAQIYNNVGGAERYLFDNIIVNNGNSAIQLNNGSYVRSTFTNFVIRNMGQASLGSMPYCDYSIFDTFTISNCAGIISNFSNSVYVMFRNFTTSNIWQGPTYAVQNCSNCFFENWTMGQNNKTARIRAFGNLNNCTIDKITITGSNDNNESPLFVLSGAKGTVVNDLTYTNISTIASPVGTVSYQPSTNWVYFTKVNGSVNDNRYYLSDLYNVSSSVSQVVTGSVLSQTTVRKSATGIAWQANVLNTIKDSFTPLKFQLAKIAFNANSLVTVKCWVKKSHATDIAGNIKIEAYTIPGLNADVTATVSNTTNWEELTLTFTPTTSGVGVIYGQAWWVANAATQSVYFDDMTITQA